MTLLRRSAIWEAAAFQPRSGVREADGVGPLFAILPA